MGSKTKLKWHYLFLFQSNWRIGGTGQLIEADSGFLTDFQGRPYLPGSSLKGKIRDSFNRLCSMRPEWRRHKAFLFGSSGNQSGQVYFQNGVLDKAYEASETFETRSRIAMDRYRQTVKDSAVLVEKLVKPHLPFYGSIEAFVTDEQKHEIGLILLLCLLDIHSIGSGSSVGHGRLHVTYGVPEANWMSSDAFNSYCWLEESSGSKHAVWDAETVEKLIKHYDHERGAEDGAI